MKTLLTIIFIGHFILNCYSQRINPIKLDSIVNKAQQLNSEALIIYKSDSLIVENYFELGHPDSLIESMSCTKSIVAIAIICLLDDGLIDSLQTPLHIYFPELNHGQKKLITIEHILNMTSGIQSQRTTGEVDKSNDFVNLALSSDLVETPSTKFRYNNKSVNILSGLVKKITGLNLDKYVEKRLFAPMGIRNYYWVSDEVGNSSAMTGCQLRPADLIKFGQLLLNKGKYNGRQIITSKNLVKLFEPSSANKACGLLWWLDYERKEYKLKKELKAELIRMGADSILFTKIDSFFIDYNARPLFYESFAEQIINFCWRQAQLKQPNKLIEIFLHTPPEYHISYPEYIGPVLSHSAKGWLGNYLVIVPSTNIVALRMISYDNFRHENNEGEGEDNYFDFTQRVLNLTREN